MNGAPRGVQWETGGLVIGGFFDVVDDEGFGGELDWSEAEAEPFDVVVGEHVWIVHGDYALRPF